MDVPEGDMAAEEAVVCDDALSSSPDVVLRKIARFLDMDSLVALTQVNHTLRAVGTESLWRNVFQRHPGAGLTADEGEPRPWHRLCLLQRYLQRLTSNAVLLTSDQGTVRGLDGRQGVDHIFGTGSCRELTFSPCGLWVVATEPRATGPGRYYVRVMRVDGRDSHEYEVDTPAFYFFFAPDSSLVLLMRNSQNRTILLEAISLLNWTKGPVLEGIPIFVSWQPGTCGSQLQLLVNTLQRTRHVQLTHQPGDGHILAEQLKAFAFASYEGSVPIWYSPTHALVGVLHAQEGGGNTLSLSRLNVTSGDHTPMIEELEEYQSYVASPDGTTLAVGIADGIELYSIESGDQIQGVRGFHLPALMAWSPDGSKIAVLDMTVARGWLIVDCETFAVSQLEGFSASQRMLQVIRFYEQYHQSRPLWSADSRSLCVDGVNDACVVDVSTGAEILSTQAQIITSPAQYP